MSKEKLQIKRRSMFGEVMVRFLRKPIAVFGAVIMIVVVALCLLAHYSLTNIFKNIQKNCLF